MLSWTLGIRKRINERQAPKRLEFISGRHHVLREIYRKFGRVFSVKRISLYLESRAGPAEKYTSYPLKDSTTRVGSQTTFNVQLRSKIHNSNSNNLISSK